MMRDPEVAYWLGSSMTTAQVAAAVERARTAVSSHGVGMLAAERKSDGAFVGSIGVRRIPAERDHPMQGEVEIGWRLAREAWGAGYASEGAAAALAWGLALPDVRQIVAFTAQSNTRSEAVMRRIGMERAPRSDFDHPALAPGHPLRSHMVYLKRKAG